MLVIFYGCSCVGKTFIMEKLNHSYNWEFVNSFTTRPSRNNERYKTTLNLADFQYKNSKGEILFPNKCYDNFYGVSKKDITLAISNDSKVWMLDFSIKNFEQTFNLPKTKRIIILPEDKEKLIENISISKRCNRKLVILEEYESYYSSLKEGYNKELDCMCVFNYKNKVQASINLITNFIY